MPHSNAQTAAAQLAVAAYKKPALRVRERSNSAGESSRRTTSLRAYNAQNLELDDEPRASFVTLEIDQIEPAVRLVDGMAGHLRRERRLKDGAR